MDSKTNQNEKTKFKGTSGSDAERKRYPVTYDMMEETDRRQAEIVNEWLRKRGQLDEDLTSSE